MRFKVGDLVRVIHAPDQSLWIRKHVGMIGIIVDIQRWHVLIEERIVVFHPLDLELLNDKA